ncbi:oxidoreductase [Kocuria sp. CNJ-770]|uniref:NAD-dependent epimerase/dehydratase family protein n=1 Tax=Kocuria sp. CNJ-770 TaxID=1904964 RepID=UPI00096856E4|nr:NAD(P)-dependent oxidoreductase [Kocuria sp. CNJ-770]OLT09703.1 oxidoreductase [Kocuria sp. CNJ-770]
MTRVVVTGGSGRLGRSVVAGLAEAGYDVVSVDRALPPEAQRAAAHRAVEHRAAELTDPEATHALMRAARPDAVVNLAAIAVPFSAPEHVILQTNAVIAHTVAEAATEAGARRIVMASSPTVLGYGSPAGWLPPALPLTEDTPPRPWHAYGLSKHVAEQVAQMFAAARGGSVRYASFRPCYVIAPEEWAGAPTQQGHTVRERLDDPALAAPALFNYVDARDVTTFLEALLEGMGAVRNGDTFFVGAADALARRPLAELIPQFVPGSEELAAGLTGTAPAFSIDKAREELGWEPARSWRTELREDAGDPASGELAGAGRHGKDTA